MIDWFTGLPPEHQITLITLIVTTVSGWFAWGRYQQVKKGGAPEKPEKYCGFSTVDAERLKNVSDDTDAIKVDIAVIKALLQGQSSKGEG